MADGVQVFVKVEEVECSFGSDTSIEDCKIKQEPMPVLCRELGDVTREEEEIIEELVCKVEPVDFNDPDQELTNPIHENEQEEKIENPSFTENLTGAVHTEPSVKRPTKVKSKNDKKTSNDDNNEFPCKHCERVFSLKSSLINHEKSHTADRYYQCDLCPKRYTHTNNLKKHKIHFHLGQKNYQCTICDKLLGTKFTLKAHLKTHEKIDVPKERSFECEVCQKGFYNKDLLQKHTRTHEQPFNCEICGKRYAKKEQLVRHLRHHVYEEPNAPQIIQYQKQITAIIATLKEQKYTCNICQGTYTQKSYLDQHINNIHKGFKRFKCEFCDKGFTARDSLLSHLRIHTGAKPFFCELCQKEFSVRSYFMVHMKLHSGETPYACHLCDKKFVRKFELAGHQLSHTGEKPFQCDVCEKQFKLVHLLKRHKESHSGQTVSCECGKKFGGAIRLRYHKKICKKSSKCESESRTESSEEIVGM